MKAAMAKNHILLETPMGLSEAQSQEIADICRENGVKLGAGLMMLFSSYHQAIKEFVEKGVLGKLVSMRAQLTCWYPEMEGSWRQDVTKSGGALADMGIHCIDLLQYISGSNVEEVCCFKANQTFSYTVEDSAALLMKMDNGATAFVDVLPFRMQF